MSKKDYELIASVIHDLQVNDVTRETIAVHFSNALALENSSFNKHRFMHAVFKNVP